jgi:hypothetical protein
MVVLLRFAPQPAGAIIFWSLTCIQLSWVALTCWRQTGLPFATAAMINGAVLSAALVTLALMGQPFPNLAPTSWVLFGGGAAVGALFLFIESRVNRDKWTEWARHMEHSTPWHIMTGRHIPDLRKGGA